MDPIRNPYAPGAGQRPPELAGRDEQLAAFDVVLQRVQKGRPERSLVLTGLRGVGKTVLLNRLRSAAMERGFGTGKWEARPDQDIRRPLAGALHLAVRELAPRHRAPERVDHVLSVLKAFAARQPPGTPMRPSRSGPAAGEAGVAARFFGFTVEISANRSVPCSNSNFPYVRGCVDRFLGSTAL